ncbi:LOB domain-containing protein 39-like [Rutidosis leptorrhynchoides]|uniref:LOB domain-containing protein 39-like n=1 Tax=Rutidosis leptorrhynchoides TaxID=125765 RepID=UPI003A997F82
MSCHGCRILRKQCSKNCVLRPCLEWIESPESKAHATLFVSKFFGRSDLISFISSVPSHKRNALFQSLLFEAVGRTVNPVNGAIGLLSTGNWHLCQAGVRTVLAGGTPNVNLNIFQIPETARSSRSFQTVGELSGMMINNQIPSNFTAESSVGNDDEMSFRYSNGEKPKLLNLLV